MSKLSYSERLKVATEHISETRYKSGIKYAQNLIKSAGEKLWVQGFKPATREEQIEFIATGVFGKHPFVKNIRLTRLQQAKNENEIERELLRARTLDLVKATRKSSEISTFETVKIGSEEIKIMTPYKAYELWQKRVLTNAEYIDAIEMWKNNTRFIDDRGKLRYAD